MNKHPRAWLWIGVTVAAFELLAVGSWVRNSLSERPARDASHSSASHNAVGDASAPQQQTVLEQEEARVLTAQRYKAAQRSPHRLEWAPEPIPPELATTSSNDAIDDEMFPKPIGMLMGHHGTWPVDAGLALDPCGDGFGCARATIQASRGTTRGLFANVSDQVAHNVTIRAGHVVARHPLSVQPAESTAFELPAELSTAELSTLSITATFVARADPRRAVLLMGEPGDISAPRNELAKHFYGIGAAGDAWGDASVITYYSEVLMLEHSTTHPGAAQSLPGQVLDAPTVIVTVLDENLKVMQVLRPPVTSDEQTGKPVPVSQLGFTHTYTIGFISHPDAGQLLISVGGAE